MNQRNSRNTILIIFSLLIYLLLSARGCNQEPEFYNAEFHAQGFLDNNQNGKWDSGEPEFPGFNLETTMTVTKPTKGNEPPKDTVSVVVAPGGVDFSFHVENLHDASDALEVKYTFKVSGLPEGYVAGSFKEEMISSNKYDVEVETNSGHDTHYYEDYVYNVYIPILGELWDTPTPTVTYTPTTTPTSTPIPTSTYTPTPILQVELIKYGSYGGGVDFVTFSLLYAPPPGTFVAYLNWGSSDVVYTCAQDAADPTILTCQGPSFPSGFNIDVFLEFKGDQIFYGQIFRCIPATPTKAKPSGPD